MKKLTALLLVLMLIFTLVACGGEKKPDNNDETPPPVTENNNGEPETENNGNITIAETSEFFTEAPDATELESTPSTEAPDTTTPATEPPVTEPAETIPETTPSDPQPEDDFSVDPTKKTFTNWKEAYLYTIEHFKATHTDYSLVNIDNDNIPELYMMGDCEAVGESVYSYKNGIVYEIRLARTHGSKYIENSGVVYNRNGNMGHYITEIYKLDSNGFSSIFFGSQTERITPSFDFVYEYSFGGNAVTEEEFNSARDSFFNIEQSTPLYQNAVNYNSIKNQINNYNS